MTTGKCHEIGSAGNFSRWGEAADELFSSTLNSQLFQNPPHDFVRTSAFGL
jgi:hypothetical protein